MASYVFLSLYIYVFTPLVEKCKNYGQAMRIGTNHGSRSGRIMSYYGDAPRRMVSHDSDSLMQSSIFIFSYASYFDTFYFLLFVNVVLNMILLVYQLIGLFFTYPMLNIFFSRLSKKSKSVKEC